MDQGPTRAMPSFVSSNLIALCFCRVDWLYQCIPGLLLVLTGHARAFCANFLRVSKLACLVNSLFHLFFLPRPSSISTRQGADGGQQERSQKGDSTTAAQNVKTTGRLEKEPQSLSSLFSCSGLGLEAALAAGKRLDCAPTCLPRSTDTL